MARHELEEDDPGARERVGGAIDAVIGVLLEGWVGAHHPTTLRHASLDQALTTTAEEQAKRGGFEVSVEVAEDAVGRSDELVFSLARELMINAAKHSRAERVWVRVTTTEVGGVLVEVGDDGVGMPERAIDDAVREGHIGLASARERVDVLGGTFAIETAADEGTVVRLVIPPHAQEQETEPRSVGSATPPLDSILGADPGDRPVAASRARPREADAPTRSRTRT